MSDAEVTVVNIISSFLVGFAVVVIPSMLILRKKYKEMLGETDDD